jgi:hypothetical protein
MMITTFPPEASRDLARAIVTGALSQTAAPTARRARVLDLGGWHDRTWRHELSELVRQHQVTAVGLRTEAHERILPDGEWTTIVDQVTTLAGLADKDWVAVRTNPRTVTLLTSDADGPLPLHQVREFGKRASVRALVAGRARRVDTAQATARTHPPAAAPARGLAQLSFTAPPAPAGPDPQPATPTSQESVRPVMRRPHSR